MGIQQGVNAISAGVLGAAVAGKHLKQQQEAIKGSELRELAGLDREIANKTDVRDKAAEEYGDVRRESQQYEAKVEKDRIDIEKRLKDKRLSPAGEKYASYISALGQIEENEIALGQAQEAADMRLKTAQRELSIYKNRKEELEKKYGKYKWYQSK